MMDGEETKQFCCTGKRRKNARGPLKGGWELITDVRRFIDLPYLMLASTGITRCGQIVRYPNCPENERRNF